jgi:hypothetical protein
MPLFAPTTEGVRAVQRNARAQLILLLVATAAGCQTTGFRSIDLAPDELTVTRTFHARFDAVRLAMQEALGDPTAMHNIAGFNYGIPVETNSQTWRAPFHKVATREMRNGERTLRAKVEQTPEGTVVTVRLKTGKPGDPARSAELLDRIAESAALQRAGR